MFVNLLLMTKSEQLGAISGVLLNVVAWALHFMPVFQLAALVLSCLVSIVTLANLAYRKIKGEKKGDRLFNHDE